jgi:4'-phosphopantetheinyl transferase EntD
MIDDLFEDGVVASVRRTPAAVAALLAEEREACDGFSETRTIEFATGRACARDALAQLGIEGFAVRRRADRTPVWPPGIVGSITHTRSFCAAAVASARVAAGIGIDAETISRVSAELWPMLLTDEEADALTQAGDERTLRAAIMFSAKEAFFKAQWPLTATWLEFTDVTVDLPASLPTTSSTSFGVRFARGPMPLALHGHAVIGRARYAGDLVVTGVRIRRGEAA